MYISDADLKKKIQISLTWNGYSHFLKAVTIQKLHGPNFTQL